MKKQFVVVLVLALIVSMIASYAPIPPGYVSPSTSSNVSAGKIEPSKYLVDANGNITHSVYFIQSQNLESCIIIAGSNTAPVIHCK